MTYSKLIYIVFWPIVLEYNTCKLKFRKACIKIIIKYSRRETETDDKIS